MQLQNANIIDVKEMKMNLKEKQELLAKFLIQHCNIDYDARCVPICVTSSNAGGKCYLGNNCWKRALNLVYIDKTGAYVSVELCTFDVPGNGDEITSDAISDALDGLKDYYATHNRKFKRLSWTKLKNIVETEPPTNSNVRH